MKNILIVIKGLKCGGGAERMATSLGSHLKESGNSVTYLTFSDDKETYDYKGEQISLNDADRVTSSWRAGVAVLRRSHHIKRVCQQRDIDAVIGFMPEANFPVVISKYWRNDAKVIVAEVDYPWSHKLISRFLIRNLYSRANTVISNSKQMQNILQQEFGLSNVRTIYNPVNIEKMKEKAQKPLPDKHQRIFTDDGPIYINVGRLHEQKGQWHLIRAFSEVVEKKPKAKLIILGGGDLRKKLKKLAYDCGVEDKVFLLGNVGNVFPYLHGADCFVLTSLWEGMPNALLEALATGLYSISCDCPTGPREIFAPDKSLDEEPDFPYRTKNGVLVPQMKYEPTYKSPTEVALNAPEKILANEMERSVKSAPGSVAIKNSERFSIRDILSEWKQVIAK